MTIPVLIGIGITILAAYLLIKVFAAFFVFVVSAIIPIILLVAIGFAGRTMLNAKWKLDLREKPGGTVPPDPKEETWT